jgi:hypothetical protein
MAHKTKIQKKDVTPPIGLKTTIFTLYQDQKGQTQSFAVRFLQPLSTTR